MSSRLRSLLAAAALAAALGPRIVQAAAPEPAPAAEKPEPWRKAFYVDGYVVPGEEGLIVPTLFLDRGSLHLEGRYNYEAPQAGSLFAGYTATFGREDAYVKLTPMVGGVFGSVRGIAPGLEVEARWGGFSYWLETEYLFDLQDGAESYLYAWSEGYYQFVPWFWAGASVQRLRVVRSPREVDLGPMVGFGQQGTPGWSLSFYAYSLGDSPWYLGTLAITF